LPGEFKEFPKMLYHKSAGPRVANTAEDETRMKSQGYSDKAPPQFPESDNPDTANMPDQNQDPLREPNLVSQIEQEKTRLAGNMGAKDPATLNQPGENGDENSEDEAALLSGRESKSSGKGKGK
jgi:hypothetical protein